MLTGIEVEIDARKAKTGADQFVRATERMAGKSAKLLGGIRGDVSKVAGAFRGLGPLIATLGAGALIRGIVNVNSQFEQMAVTLEVLEGSAAKAEASLDFITDFTAKTPFQLQNVTQSFIRLKSFGFDPTAETMQAIGDLAASFGRDIVDGVRAVDGVMRGSTEVIQEFGIKAALNGNRVTLAMGDMTREIARTPDAIAEVIREFVQLSGRTGLMEKQANTLSGSLSILKDNISLLALEIGEQGLNDEIRALTETVKDFAGSEAAAELARSLGRGLRSMGRGVNSITVDGVRNFEALVKAILVLTGAGIATKFASIAFSMSLIGKSVLAFTGGFFLGDFLLDQAEDAEAARDRLVSVVNSLPDKTLAELFGADIQNTEIEGPPINLAAPEFNRDLQEMLDDAQRALHDRALKVTLEPEIEVEDAIKRFKEQLQRELEGDPSAPLGIFQTIADTDFNDFSGGPSAPPPTASDLSGVMKEAEDLNDLFGEQIPSNIELMRETSIDAFNQLGRGIADMVTGAKVEWEDLATNIIAQMVRIWTQAQILGLARMLFGAFTGGGGGVATAPDLVGIGTGGGGNPATAPDLPGQTAEAPGLGAQEAPTAPEPPPPAPPTAPEPLLPQTLPLAAVAEPVAPEIVLPEIALPEIRLPEIVVPEAPVPEVALPEIVLPEIPAPAPVPVQLPPIFGVSEAASAPPEISKRPAVNVTVMTQPGETATVQERETNDGIDLMIITENIEGQIAGRAARGGGPFAGAVAAPSRFQR